MAPSQNNLSSSHEGASQSRLIRLIATTGLVVLAVIILFGIYFQAPLASMLVGVIAAFLLIASLFLVRRGQTILASYMLPAIGWLVGNSVFLVLPRVHPLLFVSVNGIIILLAGAILGHRAILFFALMTALLSVGITVAAANNLLVVHSEAAENWFTAGPIFAFFTLFSYYAFRDRHRAMQEAQQRAAETETLLEATSAVTASLDMKETIERILLQLEKVVPYDSASAQILRGEALEIVGGRGWENPEEVIGIQFPISGDNPNSVVIETRQPYILDNAPEAHEPFRSPPHDHIRSWLGVPLVIGETLIGMLSIDHSRVGFYRQEHAGLVQAFADQVTIAIENARHFEAEQRRRQLAAMQQDITQITSASLELDEVVQRVASLTCQALESDIAIILLRSQHGAPKSIEVHACRQDIDDKLMQDINDRLLPELTDELVGQLVPQYGASLLKHSFSSLPDGAAASLRQWFQPRQGLIVPLITAGQSTGVMLLLRLTSEPEFSDSEVELVETIAQSVAASIDNARLYAQMERMAITDDLTKLYNRRGLSQLGQRELERASRFQRAFSVLLLDLDHFKQLNDAHGHLAGDEILRQLADLLSQLVRSIDVVARYGGEEFAILLPECTLDCAHIVAERLRRAVENTTFNTKAGDLSLTISLGVASGDNIGLEMDALLNAADSALYAAKEAGRNQSWSWQPNQPIPVQP